jgi:hypothetical protein
MFTVLGEVRNLWALEAMFRVRVQDAGCRVQGVECKGSRV